MNKLCTSEQTNRQKVIVIINKNTLVLANVGGMSGSACIMGCCGGCVYALCIVLWLCWW